MWGATPGPLPAAAGRRPLGRSSWRRRRRATSTPSRARQELAVFVAPDDPVKCRVLTLTQHVDRRRGALSVFGYVEWCLGPPRAGERRFVVTEMDDATRRPAGAQRLQHRVRRARGVLARHASRRVATPCDRPSSSAAIARWRAPAALFRERLSGRAGAGLDPCAALQLAIEIRAGRIATASRSCSGRARPRPRDRAGRALLLASSVRGDARRASSGSGTRRSAPSRSTRPTIRSISSSIAGCCTRRLSCRIWARSGPYQPGGAFGFRDQLQDVLALLYARPDLCRAHLLHAASRQFVEGDVQHWWHPPSGRGTRTRCSDDLLWLPYAVASYVSAHRRRVRARRGRRRSSRRRRSSPDQTETYTLPRRLRETASLFEHCVPRHRRTR